DSIGSRQRAIIQFRGKLMLAEHGFGRVRISTDEFPADKRLTMWREIYGEGIGLVEIEPIWDQPFHADAGVTMLPNVGIARGSRSPSHFSTTPELADRRDRDALLIVLVHSGRVSVKQFGKELLTAPGAAAVLTSEDPAIDSRYTAGQFTTLALSLAG